MPAVTAPLALGALHLARADQRAEQAPVVSGCWQGWEAVGADLGLPESGAEETRCPEPKHYPGWFPVLPGMSPPHHSRREPVRLPPADPAPKPGAGRVARAFVRAKHSIQRLQKPQELARWRLPLDCPGQILILLPPAAAPGLCWVLASPRHFPQGFGHYRFQPRKLPRP